MLALRALRWIAVGSVGLQEMHTALCISKHTIKPWKTMTAVASLQSVYPFLWEGWSPSRPQSSITLHTTKKMLNTLAYLYTAVENAQDSLEMMPDGPGKPFNPMPSDYHVQTKWSTTIRLLSCSTMTWSTNPDPSSMRPSTPAWTFCLHLTGSQTSKIPLETLIQPVSDLNVSFWSDSFDYRLYLVCTTASWFVSKYF